MCHTFKHHFDECVERVTAAQEQEGYEDLEYKEGGYTLTDHMKISKSGCFANWIFLFISQTVLKNCK